jgi:16S rRNA (uracil1498-N3)-methyltransferase
MRKSRLYFHGSLKEKSIVSLDSDTTHYLSNVLRLKKGKEIRLFNDTDGEFLGIITTLDKHAITINVNSKTSSVIDEQLKIHLALSISKGDRMDYAIQKSVELGTSEITPIFSEFSDVKIKDKVRIENKRRHWQKIAKGASEQCGRFSIPTINGPAHFSDFMENEQSGILVLLDPSGSENLKNIRCKNKICLITGPEGGFAPNELKVARRKTHIVKLGNRILRSETAPLVALTILQSEFGDLN